MSRKRSVVVKLKVDSSDDDEVVNDNNDDDSLSEDFAIEESTTRKRKSPAKSKSNKKAKHVDGDETDGSLEEEGEDTTFLECGQIRKIYVENFMNHKKFSMDFGNHLNFVCGKNGSGKSAIAVAIQLCLGGKTSTTGRMKKLSEMIRDGSENPAIIRVTLRNEGCDAFEPEKYGKRITVEKTIHKNSTSTYRILDELLKSQATSKKELARITSCYNISVENPCCVLTQEESKKFIKGNPKEKYQFFLKATGLLSLGEEINKQRDDLADAEANQKKTEVILGKKKADAAKWAEVVKQFQAFDSIDDHVAECYSKAAWCDHREEGKNRTSLGEQAKASKAELEALQKAAVDLESNDTNYEETFAQLGEQIDTISAAVDEIDPRLTVAKAAVGATKKTLDSMSRSLRDNESSKQEYTGQLGRAEKLLADLKKQALQHADREERGIIEEIDQMDGEIQNSTARETKLREERGILVATTHSAAQSLRGIEQQISGHQNSTRSLQRELELAQGGGVTEELKRIQAFGAHHVRIHEEMRRARFRDEVLGPVGLHIKLKDGLSEYGPALERVLGFNLQQYICFTSEDQVTMRGIFTRCGAGATRVVFQPKKNRSLSDYRASHNVGGPSTMTVQSSVIVDHPQVEMMLFDLCNFDRIAIADSNAHMIQTLVEGNVKRLKGDLMACVLKDTQDLIRYNNGNQSHDYNRFPYRSLLTSDSSERIDRIKADIATEHEDLQHAHQVGDATRRERETSEKQLRDVERQLKQVQDSFKGLHRKKQVLQDKLQETQDAGNFDPTNQEGEIEDLKRELGRASENIDRTKATQALETAKLKEQRSEQQKLEAEKEKYIEEMSAYEAKATEIVNKQQNQKMQRSRIDKQLREKERVHDGHQREFQKSHELYQKLEQIATEVSMEKLGEEYNGEPMPLGRKETRSSLERVINEKKKEKEIGLKQQNLEGYTMAIASSNMLKAREDYVKCKKEYRIREGNITEMNADVKTRKKRWSELLKTASNKTSTMFDKYCRKTGRTGQVVFDHREKTMLVMAHMDIDQEGSEVVEVNNLSGGERSFVTFALLLALGHSIETPFRIMDEYDVFMDQTLRKKTLEELQHYTSLPQFCGRQFLIITPNSLDDVVTSNFTRISKMPDVRKVTSHGLQQQTLD